MRDFAILYGGHFSWFPGPFWEPGERVIQYLTAQVEKIYDLFHKSDKSQTIMASIFLANAPYSLEERYGNLASVGATLPHLGLLMLAAVLRKAGYRVRILDASAQGLGYEQTLEQAKKFQPDIIALTAVTPSIIKTVKLASMMKETFPSIPIVIGGPHFTAVPEQTLSDYPVFDYGVVGEGEETIIELVEALSAGRIPSNVYGLVFRENGKVRFSPPRPPIRDLDSIPFPAWELLDGFPSRYHPALFKYKKLPSTHIVSARGCPNKCIFCDTSVFSRQIRFHSAEYVLEMIGYLKRNFKIKEIIFEDDQFLIKKKRVAKICEGILKAKWDISWCCSGRVNSVNDPGSSPLTGIDPHLLMRIDPPELCSGFDPSLIF